MAGPRLKQLVRDSEFLTADVTGRALVATDFFDPTTVADVFEDDSIDSAQYAPSSIDAEHLSTDAKQGVLQSKLFIAYLSALAIAAGSGSTLATNAFIKKIVDASGSKAHSGDTAVEAIVTDAPNNKCQIRDNGTHDAVKDASDRDVFARITDSQTTITTDLAWDGSTTVLTSDTSEAVVGDFIGLSAAGPFFEITTVNSNVSFIISNPGSLTIPTGSGASTSQILTLTLSFFVIIATVETAHTMGSETIDVLFPETYDLDGLPFNTLVNSLAFGEPLPEAHTHPLSEISNVTSTAAEVNTLDGFTGVVADFELLSGQAAGGLTASDLTKLSNIDATDVEIDQALDGIGATVTAANLTELTNGSETTLHSHALTLSTPTEGNKNMTALVTASDGDKATNTTIAATPVNDGYVAVMVNKLGPYILGDTGTFATAECFFGQGDTSTGRAIAAIQSGDTLRWNGTVALFELDATDRIDFLYDV